MLLPIDIEIDNQTGTGSVDADRYVKSLVERLKVIHEVARTNEKEYQEKYKQRYDKGAVSTNFAKGSMCWLSTPPKALKGESKKLMIKYSKLVYIKEQLDKNTYIVIDHKTHKEIPHPIHSDRLKKYYEGKDDFPERDSEADEEEVEKKDGDSTEDVKRDVDVNSKKGEKNEKDDTRQATNSSDIDESLTNKLIKDAAEQRVTDKNKKQRIRKQDTESTMKEGQVTDEEKKIEEKFDKDDTGQQEEEKQPGESIEEQDNRPWHEVEKLLGSKKIKGKKYYLVKWTSEDKPTYEVASDVSDFLKRQFHANRTTTKRKRHRY